MKRCSTSLIFREMQFKTTMRYSLMPVRLVIIEKTKNNRPVLWDNMEWWGGEGGGVQDGWVQDEGDTCIPTADSCWCMTKVKVKVAQLCPTLCDPMDCGNSAGHNTGVGSLFLLQGIFPTQGLNPGLPHCRQILYQLSNKEALMYGKSHHNIVNWLYCN